MKVDIPALSRETNIPVQVLKSYLGKQPTPITVEELEEALESATTLAETKRVIQNLPRGDELLPKAKMKHAQLLSRASSRAQTILEWYEVYQHALRSKTRNKARRRIEELFDAEFEKARGSVVDLRDLYYKLPLKSRSLSWLRREVILELALHFEL